MPQMIIRCPFRELKLPDQLRLEPPAVWLQRKEQRMIFGAHLIVYSKDATADRAFFRDVLGFSSVDAGGGWLIFALPPAEVAVHPAEESARHELYFMCDDIKAEIEALSERGIRCSNLQTQPSVYIAGAARFRIRQKDLRRAIIQNHRSNLRIHKVRQLLGRHDHDRVLAAHRPQPVANPALE